MIHYDLHCSQDHTFDGWFKDSAAFERLAKRGLVECPHCGDAKVERALMRPAVAKREAAPPMPVPTQKPPQPPAAVAGGPMPHRFRTGSVHSERPCSPRFQVRRGSGSWRIRQRWPCESLPATSRLPYSTVRDNSRLFARRHE